jgi:hypothetical protein
VLSNLCSCLVSPHPDSKCSDFAVDTMVVIASARGRRNAYAHVRCHYLQPMQAQHLLTANSKPNRANQVTAHMWLAETLDKLAAPSPASYPPPPPSTPGVDASTSIDDSTTTTTYNTAVASFSLQNGMLKETGVVQRVPGELMFRGAMFYDSASNVLAILSTLRDDITSTRDNTVVQSNIFALYEPMNLTRVRSPAPSPKTP